MTAGRPGTARTLIRECLAVRATDWMSAEDIRRALPVLAIGTVQIHLKKLVEDGLLERKPTRTVTHFNARSVNGRPGVAKFLYRHVEAVTHV